MPKFGAHFIIADEARARSPENFRNLDEPAFKLGAIGPDTTLFLLDPATSNADLRKGVSTALDVLENIQDIKKDIDEIAAKLKLPIDQIAQWLSGGLYGDIKYTVNVSIEILFSAAKLGLAWGAGTVNLKNPIFGQLQDLPSDFLNDPAKAMQDWVIDSADTFGFPFRMFGHPYTIDPGYICGQPVGVYDKWWWMDLLHYRKTGKFAECLLVNALTDTQRSYALGYLTHVGGDVCGHPYINALVRGPYRNHAYRHIVLETLADTWLWKHQGRGDILDAQFDQMVDLSYAQEREVADLLVGTMREVYTPPMVPNHLAQGYPTPDEWLSAYKLMKQYLRLATNVSTVRPEPPPGNVPDVVKNAFRQLGSAAPGSLPSLSGKPMDILKALFSWFGKGLTLLVMIATFPVAIVQSILAVPGRWMVYLVNLALYYIVSAIRMMLCLTGWGYCSSDDFTNFGFLESFVTTPPDSRHNYPVKTLPNPKLPFYWLMPPSWLGNVEQIPTIPMAPPIGGLRPNVMIDSNNRMIEEYVWRLIKAQTPDDARTGQLVVEEQPGFGNAPDFINALLDGRFEYNGQRFPDFDLDGDRGYGFKPWEEYPPNERYL